jgi:ADP-heptose:LPS heptosyltransferase
MFEAWSAIRRLLLAYPHATGVAALRPAIRALRRALPLAYLTLWTPAKNEAAARRLSEVDALIIGPAAQRDANLVLAQAGQDAFDAAIIFSLPGASPYAAAYACYLAGIPVRLGQSVEFGGSVLSHRVAPPSPSLPPASHFLHLLAATGLEAVKEAPH